MNHVALFFVPEAILGVFDLVGTVVDAFVDNNATEQALMIYLVTVVVFFDYLIFCCCMSRLHDTGSMNNLIYWFIPIIGVFILSFILLFSADKGTNEYGSDPRLPYEGQYGD